MIGGLWLTFWLIVFAALGAGIGWSARELLYELTEEPIDG